MEQPSLTDLATLWGISKSYASEIRSGVHAPSRALALRIFVATGDKYGPLAGLSDDDARTLCRIDGLLESEVA